MLNVSGLRAGYGQSEVLHGLIQRGARRNRRLSSAATAWARQR